MSYMQQLQMIRRCASCIMLTCFTTKKMHGQGAPMDQDFVPLRLRVRAFFQRWPGALKASCLKSFISWNRWSYPMILFLPSHKGWRSFGCTGRGWFELCQFGTAYRYTPHYLRKNKTAIFCCSSCINQKMMMYPRLWYQFVNPALACQAASSLPPAKCEAAPEVGLDKCICAWTWVWNICLSTYVHAK